jgi:fibronectin-binding autotransporter adhesin
LGGGSSISGAVTVNSGGKLAPGNSIGTTTYSSGLSLLSGSVLDYEFGSAGNSDLSVVSGALTLPTSGSVTVNLIDNNNAGGLGSIGNGTYTLFNYGSLTNTFSASSFAVGTTPLTNKTYTFASVAGSPNVINLTIADVTFMARLTTGTPTFNTDRGDVSITGANGSYDATVQNIPSGAVSGFVDVIKGGPTEVTVTSPNLVLLDLGVLGTDFTSTQLSSMASTIAGLGGGITAVSTSDPVLAAYNYKLTGGANWDMVISFNTTSTTPFKFEWNFANIFGSGLDGKVYNVSVVPEPSSAMVLLTLGAALPMARRRRNRRA